MNRRSFLSAAAISPVALPAALASASAYPAGYHRISVEKGDPGEIPYGKLVADHKHATIYLDGVEQKHAITADAKEGWVKRLIETDEGNIAFTHERILDEVVRGAVEIRISSA